MLFSAISVRIEQPGAGQQQDGRGDFADHERGPQSARAPRRSASARARHLRQRHGRRVPRGEEAEEQRGPRGQQRGDQCHARIEGQHDRLRQRARWNERRRDAHRGPRDRQAGRTARDREQQALDEQLLNDAPAGTAERRPHRDLPSTAEPARQQQVRDVRAGHQQHERHDSRQHQRRGPQLGPDDRTAQRFDGDAPALVGVRRCDGDAIRNGAHVRAGLLQRGPRLQPSDDLHVVLPALFRAAPRQKTASTCRRGKGSETRPGRRRRWCRADRRGRWRGRRSTGRCRTASSRGAR